MVIADLKQPCTACSGSGFIAGFNQYGTFLANETGKCKDCQGKGFCLTKLGQEIWELYAPMVEERVQKALQQRTPKDSS